MKSSLLICITIIAALLWLTSCSTIEKSSSHGLNSGFYTLDTAGRKINVYADISDDTIHIYRQHNQQPEKNKLFSLPQGDSEAMFSVPVKLRKQSLDIDITTILLKYRLPTHGLPSQLTTDINAALYAGWRFDNFTISAKTDPLGNLYQKTTNLAFDVGVFGGTGATQISEFTTNHQSTREYSGMMLQGGVAAFLETNMASFGIAVGYDYLLNNDRKIWIYHKKPWLGFIVGVAIN